MTISVQSLNSCTTDNTLQGKIEVIYSNLECSDKTATAKNSVFAGIRLNDGLGTIAHNALQRQKKIIGLKKINTLLSLHCIILL